MRRLVDRRCRRFAGLIYRGVLAVVFLSESGPSAFAQSDNQASEFFRAGEAAYARGDFPAAARAFEEAHRRAPHAATLYNAALAWQLGLQLARAADDYEMALTLDGLSPPQKRDATDRLEALEKRLGHIRVVAPTNVGLVSVGHVDRAPPPVTVHALPGRHEVRLARPGGQQESTTVTVVVEQSAEISFTPLSQDIPTPLMTTDATRALSASGRRWGWIALGTTMVGLGGAAIYTGIEALEARDKYYDSGRLDRAAYDRASSLRTLTNVLWAGTALAAATGAFFMLTTPGFVRDGGTGKANATLAVGPNGAVLRASF